MSWWMQWTVTHERTTGTLFCTCCTIYSAFYFYLSIFYLKFKWNVNSLKLGESNEYHSQVLVLKILPFALELDIETQSHITDAIDILYIVNIIQLSFAQQTFFFILDQHLFKIIWKRNVGRLKFISTLWCLQWLHSESVGANGAACDQLWCGEGPVSSGFVQLPVQLGTWPRDNIWVWPAQDPTADPHPLSAGKTSHYPRSESPQPGLVKTCVPHLKWPKFLTTVRSGVDWIVHYLQGSFKLRMNLWRWSCNTLSVYLFVFIFCMIQHTEI